MTTRTHVIIPSDIAIEIDTLVGKRGRSQFLADAAAKELIRLRQRSALKQAFGAWNTEDHPELNDGVVEYVRKSRMEGEILVKGHVAGSR